MGGKNKQSQRTKNNVRPSSSGRSAELLTSAGKFDSAMTNIGGKLMPALFPTMAAVTLDAGLDPELAMCIKKLNKKDPITKTKALQELNELVNKSSVEDVEAALPGWSHFYKTLSVDGDCKVRECTQVCHSSIVRVCGRRVAPHLKQLLPSWLQAQYDDHAPAMTQAQLSLKNTFPESKLPEVIAFCKTEILDFLEDNLTGKSAVTAAAADDECGRGRAAALHGLAWTCRHAPNTLNDWLWTRVAKLLNTDAFWKLATHKEAGVRGAWFSALGSVVERFHSSLDSRLGTRLLRSLLAARENDARAHAQLWGCLLLCMHTVPEWQTWLDKKDLLAKRILNLLETGGWGDAKQLSKTLLPLLGSLPPDMLTHQFYEDFLQAIFKGLEKKSVITSKLERQSWITGLSECVRFVSLQSLQSATSLASAAHRRWLLASLTADNALLKHSAICMTDLLKFWMRKAGEEDGDKFSSLVRNFWQNIGATVSGAGAELPPELAAASAQRHELLLTAIRTSAAQPRQKHTIRFDGDSPVVTSPTTPASPEPSNMELFYHQLSTATEQVCARYIEIARDTKSPSIILPALSPLLNSLSKSSIEAVSRYLDAATVYGLFEKVLLPWLDDENTRCEAVMDVVFLLLEHMTEEEQDAMFAAFKQEQISSWALCRSLSHSHVRRPAARRFLRSDAVSRVLAAAAHSLSATDSKLLLLALTPDDDDEMLVKQETVSSVVDILVTSLRTSHSERLVCVLSQLATQLAQQPPDNYDELLLALFTVNLTIQRGWESLSLDSWVEVRCSWQDGLHSLSRDTRDTLRAHAARLLLTHALPQTHDPLEDVKISTIEHATSLCPYLLTECEHRVPSDTREVEQLIAQLFAQLVAQPKADSGSLDVFALRHDVIVSKLSCPFDDNEAMKAVVRDCDKEDVDELKRDVLVLRLTEILFRTLCLRTLFLHRPDTDDSNDDKQQTWCSVLLRDKNIQAEFCRLLRDYVVVHSLHEGYAFWPHYEIIERVKHKLDSSLQDIISETPVSVRREILMYLSSRAAKEGYYWAYARAWFEANAANKTDDPSEDQSIDMLDFSNVDLANLAEVVTGNGLYHSLQANVRFPSTPPPAPSAEDTSPSPALRAAHLAMVRAALAALEAEAAPRAVRELFASHAGGAARGDAGPDVIVDLYYKFEKVLVGERSPSTVSWQTAVCSAAIWEYLALLTEERGWSGASHHWDFTTISLCAALQTLTHRHTTKTALLCVSSLRLLRSVQTFMKALPAECEKRQPSPHVAALIDEWKDIFSPDIHTNLFNVILRVLDSPPPGPISCHVARSLSALTAAASSVQWSSIPPALRADTLSLQRVCSVCAGALAAATHRGYKYLAHSLLSALADDLLLEDADKLQNWSSANAEGQELPAPALSVSYFHDHYLSLLELLDAALHNVQVGEATCEMSCGSDARGVALGALLLCDVTHRVCERARGDLTHHYINLFREEKYTDLLLSGAVRLLPADVFSWASDPHAAGALPDRLVSLFTTSPAFTLDEAESSCWSGVGDVGALACRGVYHALSGPGQPSARAAWAAWPARPARALARLAAAAVAPQILKEQFRRAAKRANTLVDTELILLPAAREAQAVHTVEDQPLRLTITFSPEHPLTPPKVQSPSAGPAAATPWLSMYLGYQRGDLLSAVSLWITAVGAKVERAPQCYICYCRLHPGEGVLPKVYCNQCRNKFHNACLRKWFTTSKKSNCPVCRAMF